MFERLAQKGDQAAIRILLGRMQSNLAQEFEERGYSKHEAESLAEQNMIESMRAAGVDIHSYESVRSWANSQAYSHPLWHWRRGG